MITNYTYDALNRPLTNAYPANTDLNVTFVYDTTNAECATNETFAIGRMTQMTDHSGTTSYCYDRHGNTVRKKQTTSAGGVPLTTQYAYSTADRLDSITYPSGMIIGYQRDTVGRTNEVTYKANAAASCNRGQQRDLPAIRPAERYPVRQLALVDQDL